MFLKNLKKATIGILLSLLIVPTSALAYSQYIIPGGENIGIELNAKGVMVVGLYKVNNTYPAGDAGLRVGDTITDIDDAKVANIEQMVSKMNTSTGVVKITYMRSNIKNQATLKLYKDENNVYKTGLYVKDSITGIGTLSFIDPESKTFGALGHEIIEKSTGKLLEIKDGKIFASEVTSIDRSENGAPGEKNAKFETDQISGQVEANTTQGIFGTYTKELPDKKKYKVAQPDEIKEGSAKIMTVLDGKEIKEYSINITKISHDTSQKTKNILFEVTDSELLQKTGGIVAGMSGSPIIQGDKIVAVVTHVVIQQPSKGYGIFITNMLKKRIRD